RTWETCQIGARQPQTPRRARPRRCSLHALLSRRTYARYPCRLPAPSGWFVQTDAIPLGYLLEIDHGVFRRPLATAVTTRIAQPRVPRASESYCKSVHPGSGGNWLLVLDSAAAMRSDCTLSTLGPAPRNLEGRFSCR